MRRAESFVDKLCGHQALLDIFEALKWWKVPLYRLRAIALVGTSFRIRILLNLVSGKKKTVITDFHRCEISVCKALFINRKQKSYAMTETNIRYAEHGLVLEEVKVHQL
jgi:hypothetical protein